jgi:hypothetical protein
MILKLAKDKNHKELPQNEWFFQVEEFRTLTDRQAEFVALISDFESPIPKGLPDKERRKLAALQCGWKTRGDKNMVLDTRGLDMVHGKNPGVEIAIKKYKEFQKEISPDYQMLEFLNERIEHLKTTIRTPSADLTEEKIKTSLTKELFELYEEKREFEKKIGKPVDPNVVGEVDSDAEDGGDRNLSLIDKVNTEKQP